MCNQQDIFIKYKKFSLNQVKEKVEFLEQLFPEFLIGTKFISQNSDTWGNAIMFTMQSSEDYYTFLWTDPLSKVINTICGDYEEVYTISKTSDTYEVKTGFPWEHDNSCGIFLNRDNVEMEVSRLSMIL